MQEEFEMANAFKVKMRLPNHRMGITAIRFSSGGRLLGIADDGGYLVIQETERWRTIRKLKASAPIRAFEFHPVDQQALVVGCTNGEIIKVVLNPNGVAGDFYGLECVDGFIHAIAIDDEGSQVAVAYANTSGIQVKIFTLDTFRGNWGNGRFLPTPVLDQTSFSGYPFIRSLVFLMRDKILVTFFPDTLGLRVFNVGKFPFQVEKRIKLRPGTLVGGAAVSPSRRIVAVMNMLDGIDIYNIAKARLVKTIIHDLAELYMTEVRFLDEERLVLGYSRGTLVIANCSRTSSVTPIMIDGVNADPLQSIAVATINGVLWIAAGSIPIHEMKGKVALFCRDQEDTNLVEEQGVMMRALNKVTTAVKYSLVAMVLIPVGLVIFSIPSTTQNTGTNVPPEPSRTPGTRTATASASPSRLAQSVIRTTTSVSTTTSTVTRIANIPGPMTTSTKLVVKRITETNTLSVEVPTPACTTRTLVEMVTQTVTAMAEATALAHAPYVCSGYWICYPPYKTLDYIFDVCAITALSLIGWSLQSNDPNPNLEVLKLVAEPLGAETEDGDVPRTGSERAGSGLGGANKDSDVEDHDISVNETIGTETNHEREESEEESIGDETEGRDGVFDASLDAEAFADGVNADERNMRDTSPGGDSDSEAEDEAEGTSGEVIVDEDVHGDEGQSPRQGPEARADVTESETGGESPEVEGNLDSVNFEPLGNEGKEDPADDVVVEGDLSPAEDVKRAKAGE